MVHCDRRNAVELVQADVVAALQDRDRRPRTATRVPGPSRLVDGTSVGMELQTWPGTLFSTVPDTLGPQRLPLSEGMHPALTVFNASVEQDGNITGHLIACVCRLSIRSFWDRVVFRTFCASAWKTHHHLRIPVWALPLEPLHLIDCGLAEFRYILMHLGAFPHFGGILSSTLMILMDSFSL